MNILSISTSSDICSVCVGNETHIQKENYIRNARTHSEHLMPLIEQTLKDCQLDLKDIDYFACDIGPGSFTGIRIGIATVKAIAQITGKPICAISSLEGLAYAIEKPSTWIASLVDARNDQVYAGLWDDKHQAIDELMADDIHIVLEKLASYHKPITFVGNGSILHQKTIQDYNPNNAFFSEQNDLLASHVWKASLSHIAQENVVNADTLLPLYLRKSQAERMKENSGK